MENKHNQAVTIFLVVVIVLLIAGLGVMTYFVIDLNKKVESQTANATTNQNAVEQSTNKTNTNTNNEVNIPRTENNTQGLNSTTTNSAQELLNMHNVKSTDMFNKILNNIANTVTCGQFLLNTEGRIDSDTISIENFRKNINTYSSTLANRYDLVTLYVENGQLKVKYTQKDVLEALGMGTHMGIGLIRDSQIVELSGINSAQELLNMYNVKSTDMFNKILNNIANTVTCGQFLLNTEGRIDSDTISIENFRNNINTYSSTLANRYDLVTLFVENGKLKVKYTQNSVLEALGMGTHMGKGLVLNPQTIELN